MTLESFIECINETEGFNLGNSASDKDANDLAKAFENNMNKSDEELRKIICCSNSTDNDILSAKIILNTKENEKNKYQYIQNKKMISNIELFKPYIDDDKKKLNQKWHVLISLLAVLDICSFDETLKECSKVKKYNIGKIEEITLDKKILRISARTVKTYKSAGMIEFINQAINSNQNQSI